MLLIMRISGDNNETGGTVISIPNTDHHNDQCYYQNYELEPSKSPFVSLLRLGMSNRVVLILVMITLERIAGIGNGSVPSLQAGVFGVDNDGGGEGVIMRANTAQNGLSNDIPCHGR